MIQQIDIDDMKPERKFEEGLPHADNHIGWDVDEWAAGVGYFRVEGPFETRGNAEAVKQMLQQQYPDSEFFIHEALKAK